MSFKIMPKAVLSNWVARLQRNYRVVGPVERHGSFVFDELNSAEELRLVYPPTVLPPKKYIVPPRETLVNYRLDGTHISASINVRPTVILGMHTCDLHGVMLLDQIFDMGFDDQHYRAHRENSYLVSIECMETCTEDSFCRDMGTASASRGFDLHFIDLDDVYAVNMATRKGQKLLEGLHHAFDALPSDMMREGVGACEVPRGVLFHHYKIEDGRITGANCIIPTNQNVANVEADMRKLVPTLMEMPQDEIANRLEMLVRAYDPCISCSTHLLEVKFE